MEWRFLCNAHWIFICFISHHHRNYSARHIEYAFYFLHAFPDTYFLYILDYMNYDIMEFKSHSCFEKYYWNKFSPEFFTLWKVCMYAIPCLDILQNLTFFLYKFRGKIYELNGASRSQRRQSKRYSTDHSLSCMFYLYIRHMNIQTTYYAN